jgi:hypothetical protein
MNASAKKYILEALVIIQMIAIGLLFARNHVSERMTTDVVRGRLVAETAMFNVFCEKLDSGDLELVKRMMQSTVSNNIVILQNGTYGSLDQDQSEALKAVLKAHLSK